MPYRWGRLHVRTVHGGRQREKPADYGEGAAAAGPAAVPLLSFTALRLYTFYRPTPMIKVCYHGSTLLYTANSPL